MSLLSTAVIIIAFFTPPLYITILYMGRRSRSNRPFAKHAHEGVATSITFLSPSAAGPASFTFRPGVDSKAPAELLFYGLNRSRYAPVITTSNKPIHFVFAVARVVNLNTFPLRLTGVNLILDLGGRAHKSEPPATLATLARLFFHSPDSQSAQTNLLKEKLLELLAGPLSLNRPAVELPPRHPAVLYAAFTPPSLIGLPVFDGEELNFGISFIANGKSHTRYGFRARPLLSLEVVQK